MIAFKSSSTPGFIRDYKESTGRRLFRKPLDQVRLVALDTEATGFEVGRDRLLSVGVIELDWRNIMLETSLEWLVYQPNVVINKATEIHGILPSDTLQGITEKQMIQELLPLLSDAIVIGDQIWFDTLMLNDAFRRNYGIPFQNPTIDVGLMAMNELQAFRKSGYINQRPPSLEDLCAHFGLPLHDRHTAEGDAYLAAEIFLLMCGYIRQRKGQIAKRDLPIKKT